MTHEVRYKPKGRTMLIHFVDQLVAEIGNISWLQADVAEENKQDGRETNLHHYVDLAQDESLKMTKNMLRLAHSQCEKLLEGMIFKNPVDLLSLDNGSCEMESLVTEIMIPNHMNNVDAENICWTMEEYMKHFVLCRWASIAAPQFVQQWNDELNADASALIGLNKKRNRVVTSRAMSAL